ncbi:Chitin synthase, class 1 [Scheffersomyces spartinae]|uniref:chitin synthase n=1 Tax=Scheffersomyces spartinae TaxID=45513 RepID=A0A9P7VF44_9ASCO|nr:Chitin synthase, class 1 [Scheffersomyces spartinae]KAG7196283.1 Chitin synthase, class 1 [Scheffersomyces spartinae]
MRDNEDDDDLFDDNHDTIDVIGQHHQQLYTPYQLPNSLGGSVNHNRMLSFNGINAVANTSPSTINFVGTDDADDDDEDSDLFDSPNELQAKHYRQTSTNYSGSTAGSGSGSGSNSTPYPYIPSASVAPSEMYSTPTDMFASGGHRSSQTMLPMPLMIYNGSSPRRSQYAPSYGYMRSGDQLFYGDDNFPNPGGSEAGGNFAAKSVQFTGDDYMPNLLEDAEEDDGLDPFGDDDSLFSETEEDIQRGQTIKRKNTLRRRNTQYIKEKNEGIHDDDKPYDFSDDNDDADDDFRPRLNYTKTIKKARMVNGNYSIDCPVPQALLDNFGSKVNDRGTEMSFMRYTACTCGPSNFGTFGYNVRQALYTPVRETELMVCITMYNEDDILLARTLKGVFENIQNLTKRNNPNWGKDSWKKIVVCIVNDGRMELNERTKNLLLSLGCYQEGYAKSRVNEHQVKIHIYEYTSIVGIDSINDKVNLTINLTPVQFLFVLKEQNKRKINSHRWCFQAIAPILQPRVIILLDCGTRPAKDAFYHLWKNFQDPAVAGACGEMRASLGNSKKLLLNPLVAAQNFEYKISNVLDKPMESVFGFISVLPGAFSAYRWEALLNVDGEGPLEKYFKGEFLHEDNLRVDSINGDEDDERQLKEKNYRESGIFTSNMYLAEDRILCFELVAKKGHNYVLKYVNEAKAETDVPESIDEFVLQRRRWLNGSLFAAAYAVIHWTNIWKSEHLLMRKLFLQFEFYYQLITLFVSWFSIASFFLVFRILTANLGSAAMNFDAARYIAIILLWCYVACVITTFVLSFGNTPKGAKKFYLVVAILFAVMMAYMMFAAVYLAIYTTKLIIKENPGGFKIQMFFTDSRFRDLVISLLLTYALYLFGALLYGEPLCMFTSFVPYLLLSPTYVNVLNIYAFCNIHDVSWGTKGNNSQAKDLGAAKILGEKDNELVMVAPAVDQELNDAYIQTLDKVRTPPEFEKVKVTPRHSGENYYAFLRTVTVLVWMLTNAILIVVVLQSGGLTMFTKKASTNPDGSILGGSNIFLGVILWIVAALALFRFCGSVMYMIFKGFRPLKWKKANKKAKKQGLLLQQHQQQV